MIYRTVLDKINLDSAESVQHIRVPWEQSFESLSQRSIRVKVPSLEMDGRISPIRPRHFFLFGIERVGIISSHAIVYSAWPLLASNIQHCPMQCVLRRWNVHTIGRNATLPCIALVVPQYTLAHLSRTIISVPPRRNEGKDGPSTPSTLRSPRKKRAAPASQPKPSARPRKPKSTFTAPTTKDGDEMTEKEQEQWQVQKAALKEKFGDEAWNPRKKLSPDTMEGIRAMHASDPERFTTPVLAENFQVSPEAIRRILKSKWQPSSEAQERRRERWEQRGERVWSHLAEMGVKPPKPWRVRGVGKAASAGDMPLWKGRGRVREDAHSISSGEATTVRRGLVATKASPGSPATSLGSGRNISDRIL
jgi:hypothetical protein